MTKKKFCYYTEHNYSHKFGAGNLVMWAIPSIILSTITLLKN